MSARDIIVIGASTGGVEALTNLARDLPADLPASVFVVMHTSPESTSALPAILDRSGPLRAAHAKNGETIEPGHIYIAPPDRHLLIEDGRTSLGRGPKENRHRPAVDPLFRSAALAYGPRVAGVILTGALDDGTSGLMSVKQRGGLAIVQDPDDALFPGMPENALEYVDVDHRLPLSDITPLLARLAREEVAAKPAEKGASAVNDEIEQETNAAALFPAATGKSGNNPPGEISAYSCPECQGPLWEMQEGKLLRFRCRVGHAFTAESMLAEKSEMLENALWSALNTLEESAALSRRLTAEARERQRTHGAKRFEERARNMEKQATVIRQVLTEEDAV